MTTDSPEPSSATAIGSPAFKAAKEAAQARGWVMEPSVISAMLAAAVPFIREAIAAEVEAEAYMLRGRVRDAAADLGRDLTRQLHSEIDGRILAAWIVRGTDQ